MKNIIENKKKDELKQAPDPEKRNKILKNIHYTLTAHGGTNAVYYGAKKKYYWPRIKGNIKNIINNCEACTRNKQKSESGEIFVITKNKIEIVGIDIMKITHSEYIVSLIDYFTRFKVTQSTISKDIKIATKVVEKMLNMLETQK